MNQAVLYSGKYDDLLIGCVKAINEAGQTPSNIRLIHALQSAVRISLVEASKAVDDFCERGVLQVLLGPGPYDEWLTAELEAARRWNRGLNGNSLARQLQSAHPVFQGNTSRHRLLGLANAVDTVDDYFVRYGLPSVLGPYPLSGVIIVVLTEALLFLPVSWAVHFGLSSLLLGRPASGTLFAFFSLLFLAGSTWKNWRKLRSPRRWKLYDAARDRLHHRPRFPATIAPGEHP